MHVNLSINSLDAELARTMEPRTSIPAARLRAVQLLSEAGVPVRVMVAPLIPGLNDHEAPEILKQAREAGARDARYIMLRLPLTVAPVFQEWLERTQSLRSEKVLHQISQVRGGKINDSNFGSRMLGTGPLAEHFRSVFAVFRRKFGYQELEPMDASQFVPPRPTSGQLSLF